MKKSKIRIFYCDKKDVDNYLRKYKDLPFKLYHSSLTLSLTASKGDPQCYKILKK